MHAETMMFNYNIWIARKLEHKQANWCFNLIRHQEPINRD